MPGGQPLAGPLDVTESMTRYTSNRQTKIVRYLTLTVCIRLCFLAALMTLTSALAAHEFRLSEDRIEAILRSLPGYWHGKAIETPLGPMDYDMLFHSCSDGTIAGVANTGASLHYWQFSHRDGNLRIRFLSTFAGNRTPVLLKPTVPSGASLNFFAPQREILTLGITATENQIDIRVFHWGKPHVQIRLSGSTKPPQEMPPHHSLVNSCRGKPAD